MMLNNELSYYRFPLIFQVVYPIVLFVIGLYLLKDGKSVAQIAFRGISEKNEESTSLLFVLFMKLAGLVLIIYSLPNAFQLISNILFTSSVNVVGTSEQTQFIVQHLVTTSILTEGDLF